MFWLQKPSHNFMLQEHACYPLQYTVKYANASKNQMKVVRHYSAMHARSRKRKQEKVFGKWKRSTCSAKVNFHACGVGQGHQNRIRSSKHYRVAILAFLMPNSFVFFGIFKDIWHQIENFIVLNEIWHFLALFGTLWH